MYCSMWWTKESKFSLKMHLHVDLENGDDTILMCSLDLSTGM